jgi:hypothetical protein
MTLSSSVDAIWYALASDAQILAFKGLTPTSPIENIRSYIQRTEETEDVVDADSIPLILIYTRPGSQSRKSIQFYYDKVVIDSYASDDDTAKQMADRIFNVLQNGVYDAPDIPIGNIHLAYHTSFKTRIQGIRGYRLYFDVMVYIG